MTMYLTHENGNIDKGFKPVYDATMQGKEYAFDLIETYLNTIDTRFIERVVFTGDGAPWIWSRAETLLSDCLPDKEAWQVLDYTHAKQALEEILDLLPKKKKESSVVKAAKDLGIKTEGKTEKELKKEIADKMASS